MALNLMLKVHPVVLMRNTLSVIRSIQSCAVLNAKGRKSRAKKKELSRYLDPKVDVTFKHVFTNKGNTDILQTFINDVLSFTKTPEVEEISSINPQPDLQNVKDKKCLFDVYCIGKNKKRILIEMQLQKDVAFTKRFQYYIAAAYVRQLTKGEHYSTLDEVLGIAISSTNIFPEETEFITKHIIQNVSNNHNHLKDLTFIFIELEKFNLEVTKDSERIYKWAYFLKYADIVDEQMAKSVAGDDSIILKAYEQLDSFNCSQNFLNKYIDEKQLDEKIRNASIGYLEEGLAQGEKRGKKESKLETAKKLILLGFPNNFIVDVTNLTEEEVEKIRYDMEPKE